MTPDSQLAPGKPQPGDVILGKYSLQRVLGSGGMGVVFAAQHLELDRRVAVKFLHTGFDNPEVAARFLREARAAVRIESEHVAKVIDVGRLDDQTPFIVMEYLEGEDLSFLLERQQVAIGDAVDYVIQACSAMSEAHELGIVHRDLKPANLFLTRRRDGSPSIKVLDFGISKWNEPDSSKGLLTNPTEFLGSPVYMSPEQLKSALLVDARTDVWSLGVILFELLAGRPAFESPSLAMLMAAILHEPAQDLRELRPDVPEELAKVVQRCLVKDREQRLQSVAELAVALLPFAPHRSYWNIERLSKASGLQAVSSAARSADAVSNGGLANSAGISGTGSGGAEPNDTGSGAAASGLAGSSSAASSAGGPAQGGATLVAAGRSNDVTASPWVGEGTQAVAAKSRAARQKVALIAGAAALAAAGFGALLLVRASGESETPSTASGSAAVESHAAQPLAPAATASVHAAEARTVLVQPVAPDAVASEELVEPRPGQATDPAAPPGTQSPAPGATASTGQSKTGNSPGLSRPNPPPVSSRIGAPQPRGVPDPEPRGKPPKPPKPENPLEMDLK